MRLAITLLLIVLSPGWVVAQSARPRADESIAFTHVTVIDGTGSAARHDLTVVVTGDRITAIGDAKSIRLPRRARVIDATGKYLIPGLWDMHVHLQEAGLVSLPLLIANGVTSVRDMGTTWSVIRSCKNGVAEGKTIGPRIKASGPLITNPRVYDLIQKNAPPDIQQREAARRIRVETPEQMRKAVDDLVREGADFIKLHWNNTRETYTALAEETKKRGTTFAGHDPLGGLTLREISDAGQRSIEHIDGAFASQLRKMDEAGRKETYELLVRNRTHFVPTLAVLGALDKLAAAGDVESRLAIGTSDPRAKYLQPGFITSWRWFLSLTPTLPRSIIFLPAVSFLGEMRKAGVRIMPGTDLGVPLMFPGFSLHEELAQLVRAVGMSPTEAIVSATRYPAEFFGLQESLGTIEKGKLADLVLLDADPLQDITNTRRINSVVVGGRVYDRARLDALLEKVRSDLASVKQ